VAEEVVVVVARVVVNWDVWMAVKLVEKGVEKELELDLAWDLDLDYLQGVHDEQQSPHLPRHRATLAAWQEED
jgi:EAL domain-containing protein (putative c-di-GMP-specific phosphodiesterase class I)